MHSSPAELVFRLCLRLIEINDYRGFGFKTPEKRHACVTKVNGLLSKPFFDFMALNLTSGRARQVIIGHEPDLLGLLVSR